MKKSLKNSLKRIIPVTLWSWLQRLRQSMDESGLFFAEKQRFKRYYARAVNNAAQQQLEAKLIFHAHSLEKGLSHREIRLGFGKTALSKLSSVMHEYDKLGYSKKSKAYENALSVLNAYLELHDKSSAVGTSQFDELFSYFREEITKSKSNVGGVRSIDSASKRTNKTKNFRDLFLGRCSVRDFGEKDVNISLINDAIDISQKAPSICNRQTSRVLIVDDPKTIKSALGIQAGMNGYKAPPLLLAVLTDIRGYVSLSEHNQPYIDGGLYAMSMLLSLEYQGLAACPLNTMFKRSQEKRMRKLLSVPPYENFIMFIAVGTFSDGKTHVPRSFRYTHQDIARFHKA